MLPVTAGWASKQRTLWRSTLSEIFWAARFALPGFAQHDNFSLVRPDLLFETSTEPHIVSKQANQFR